MTTWYDPPSGWKYGFPKEYKPLEGEELEDTLRRDGYPQKEIDWGAANHVRMWGKMVDDEINERRKQNEQRTNDD